MLNGHKLIKAEFPFNGNEPSDCSNLTGLCNSAKLHSQLLLLQEFSGVYTAITMGHKQV